MILFKKIYYTYMVSSGLIRFGEINPKHQTRKMCLIAVNRNGLELSNVTVQNEEICLAAVRNNGLALRFVKNQTEEICLAAVKQDTAAMVYVENQTEGLCIKAIQLSTYSFEYIVNKTELICMAALDNGPDIYTFQHIKNEKLTKSFWLEAIIKKPAIISIINDSDIEYGVDDIKKAFKVISNGSCLRDTIIGFYKNTLLFLSKLNDKDLVKTVNKDLKDLFDINTKLKPIDRTEYISVNNIDGVRNLKEKVILLEAVYDGGEHRNKLNDNKKSRVI